MKQRWLLLAIGLALLPLEIIEGMDTNPAHVGLNNLGNTCYMNAALQCLVRTQPLHDALIRLPDEAELSSYESIIPKEYTDKFDLHKKTLQEFIKLNKLFSSAITAVEPTNFYDAFFNSANINGAFNNGKYQQEDADEAIKILFDAIFLEITTKQATENTASEFFYPFKISQKIGHFFTGEEVSIQKRECKHNSSRNTPLQSLSIELPDNKESNLTLEKLLTEMFKEEILTEGENLLECEFCEKGSRYDLSDGNSKFAKVKSLSKALKLNLIPEILITSLKRFEFDFETMSKNKIYTQVKFPEQLIIAPKWTTDDCPQKNATYELYGMIIHDGNANGGHYTAYVKDALTRQWWDYDDNFATQSTPIFNDERIYAAFYRLVSSGQLGIQVDPIEEDKDDEEDHNDPSKGITEKPEIPNEPTQKDLTEYINALENLIKRLDKLISKLNELKAELKKLSAQVDSLITNSNTDVDTIIDGILAEYIVDMPEFTDAIMDEYKKIPLHNPQKYKKECFIQALETVKTGIKKNNHNPTIAQLLKDIEKIKETALIKFIR